VKPLTEKEKTEKKQKEGLCRSGARKSTTNAALVLFLRHKLQKGFLSRDQAPKEEEMKPMAEHFRALEGFKDLEVDMIRSTKIHKVLKAIIKLNSIPKDEEYRFKERSIEILDIWQKAMASSDGSGGAGDETAATKGTKEEKDEDDRNESAVKETAERNVKEPSEATVETSTNVANHEVDETMAGADAKVDALEDASADVEDAAATDEPAAAEDKTAAAES